MNTHGLEKIPTSELYLLAVKVRDTYRDAVVNKGEVLDPKLMREMNDNVMFFRRMRG